jgi:putative SOS response-associated peptidase YedK
MAVILADDKQKAWLTEPADSAKTLLEPHSANAMHAYPVSTAVNDPATDHAELVDAVDSPTTAGTAKER